MLLITRQNTRSNLKFVFYYYYNLIASLRAKVQRANIVKEIIQYSNAYNFLFIFL